MEQLNVDECRRLAPPLAALLVSLLVRASEPALNVPLEPRPADVVWLNVDQVTERFGLTRTWLEEHRDELKRLGLISRPSRKMWLFDARKLKSYLENRRG